MAKLKIVAKTHGPKPEACLFGDLEQGDLFAHSSREDDEDYIYVKVEDRGQARNSCSLRLTTGRLMVTSDAEEVYKLHGRITVKVNG